MRKNKELFEAFIETEESFDKYCARIAQRDVWGGQPEIQALCELLGVNAIILQAATEEASSTQVGMQHTHTHTHFRTVY